MTAELRGENGIGRFKEGTWYVYIEEQRGNEWEIIRKERQWVLKLEKTSETTFGGSSWSSH